MSNLLQITSTPAETVPAENLQLVVRWKNTDKRTISAANSRRAVTIPANIWREGHDCIDCENKMLHLFMHDAVEELARSYLSAIVEESNWLRTEVPLEHFHLSSLLTWSAERAALAGRLNGEEIKAWLASSVTITSATTAHGAAIATALGEQFVRLASPNHGLTPERAGKLLAGVWKQEDCDSTTGLRVMLRLTAISQKAQERADLLASLF